MTKTLESPAYVLTKGSLVAGKYRILEEIGRGGMGEVYLGYDDTLQRKVAVKAIAATAHLSPERKARFLREARALSRLEHPNICKIYDFIESAGAAFLILEFIEGRTLGQAIQAGIVKPDRFRIALEIARVLVVAHGKGIVHRDLKPANIKLTPKGEVKVLDFGLARFLGPGPAAAPSAPVSSAASSGPGPELTAGDAVEEVRAEDEGWAPLAQEPAIGKTLTLGTLSRSSSGPSDFLSDSLPTEQGTVMGTPQYMSPEQARGEHATAASDMYSFGLILQEIFTEHSSYEDTEDRATLFEWARKGQTRPVTGLSSDLTSLINRLKSLVPTARPTAVEAVEQLDRIREKPKRRLRRAIVGGIAAAFVLAGVKYTLDVRRERDRANKEAEVSRQVSDFLTGLFKVSDPSEARGNSITAREILDKGAKEIKDSLKDQPAVQSRLMATMGDVYTSLGLYQQAEPILLKAIETQRRSMGNENLDTLKSIHNLANLYWYMNRPKDAEPLYLEVVEARRRILGEEHPDTLRANYDLASLYHIQGLEDKAEQLTLKTLNIQRRVLGREHKDTLASLHNLSAIYWATGRYKEALPLNQEGYEIRRRTLGEDHPNTISSIWNLATVYERLGDNLQAEREYVKAIHLSRRVLGDQHPSTVPRMNMLAGLYQKLERFDKVEELFKLILMIKTKAPKPDPQDLMTAHRNLAEFYQYCLEKDAEAEMHFRKIIDIGEQAYGKDNMKIVQALNDLARFYALKGEYGKADPYLTRSLAITEKSLKSENPDIARARLELATNYAAQGKSGKAKSLYLPSIKIYRESQEVDKAGFFYAQARYWAASKNPGKAIQNLKQAVELGHKKSIYSDPYLKPLCDNPGIKAVYADTLNHLNLDFEDYTSDGKPKFWLTYSYAPEGAKKHEVSIDQKEAYSGKVSLCIERTSPGQGFGEASSSFPIEFARGKRLRFSAHIKTENVTDGYPRLYWAVFGPAGSMLAWDNLQGRGDKGTTPWHGYVIELDIPKLGNDASFGVSLSGSGKAWFDNLEITLNGISIDNL